MTAQTPATREAFIPHPRTVRAIQARLLKWFEGHQRDLPWRGKRNAYAVWVSEMMLQQTQVATVIPFFERWMKKYPTVRHLAAAGQDDVLHSWQGLGYYRRARALHAGAKVVSASHDGVVPRDVAALRALPGIGAYTAGAIASIAYGVQTPIVDGNVIRVLCRLFAQRGDPAKAPLKHDVWTWASTLVPESDPSSFNQAMMELGALVCRPQRPACEQCPVRNVCRAKRQGLEKELPEVAKAAAPTKVLTAAAIVRRGADVLVSKRPENAPRWAGLWEFPQSDVVEGEDSDRAAARAVREATGLHVHRCDLEVELRHSVTRYAITLKAYGCELEARARTKGTKGTTGTTGTTGEKTPRTEHKEFRWLPPSELARLPMSAPHRKLARKIAARVGTTS
jgi:A/G-specific adenine glycosylase